MLDGNKFLPETGIPILNRARSRLRLEVWLPDPFIVATVMAKSLTTCLPCCAVGASFVWGVVIYRLLALCCVSLRPHIDEIEVFIEDLMPFGEIARGNGLDNGAVHSPDLVEVLNTGVAAEADFFVSRPIGIQQAEHEGILDMAEDGQVQFAVFAMRHANRLPLQQIFGALYQVAQMGYILYGQLLHGLKPIGTFEVSAHVGELVKGAPVARHGVKQAFAHRWSKRIRQPADARARAYLNETQSAGHLQLLAQHRDGDAILSAERFERGQAITIAILIEG